MSTFRLQLNNPGFSEIRKSAPVQAELHRRGAAIADAAGGAPDFEIIDSPSATRARVVVVTATVDGMRAEAVDRSLSRAFDAGRG